MVKARRSERRAEHRRTDERTATPGEAGRMLSYRTEGRQTRLQKGRGQVS